MGQHEPARSRSTWSISPTSIAATNVHTLRPGCAPPTRPPNRTVRSTKPSKVPGRQQPSVGHQPLIIENRLIPVDILQYSTHRKCLQTPANHHVSYGYCPRSEALSASIHPQPQNIYRWIQALNPPIDWWGGVVGRVCRCG